ncbi:MAG: ATP-binding cassette domain-containing protein [Caldilineaceae bacterium]|nr:ATP-binding cassette domain-containing protein [Caldilineaceae bacterium]
MSQPVLEVDHLRKTYGDFVAVDDLTFRVQSGEIFGLLGPNGAGKTTTIRMIMDIFIPDAGTVSVLGATPRQARLRVGYLPEERGLYRDLKVKETLVYLAQLKGMDKDAATRSAEAWLDRVGLADWADKRVKDLSRGMQQKAQFASAVVHEPDLLILDEPFQGLDPVNVELVKTLMRELQAEGRTIVLSAHQMNLVEEMCDRILLINRGEGVLYGELAAIKRDYAPNAVRISGEEDVLTQLTRLEGVVDAEQNRDVLILRLGQTSPQAILAQIVELGLPIRSFEVESIPLNDIFVNVVSGVHPDGSEEGAEA